MNPRHRRLLIPGLLIALVVVVVISSLVRRADATDVEPNARPLGVIDDARVTEASGLAIPRDRPGFGYVVNDSGHGPVVFTVELASGDVVGATTVTGATWHDTEAVAVDSGGTVWVADTGDNRHRRDDAALYAIAAPRIGDHTTTARRYPVSYPDGGQDVETLLIDPHDGAKYLVSKGLLGGSYYRLPDELSTSGNQAVAIEGRAPGMVTDGSFTPDGERIVLRTYSAVHLVNAADRSEIARIWAPPQEQAESLSVEPDGRHAVLGTEGRPSPMFRLNLPVRAPAAAPTRTPSPAAAATRAAGDPVRAGWWWGGAGGLAVVLVSTVLVIHRARGRASRR